MNAFNAFAICAGVWAAERRFFGTKSSGLAARLPFLRLALTIADVISPARQ